MIFSVIVPAYNVKEFLPICMESILQQNYHDFEIVLVNDGSTDGTADLCARYSELDNVVYISQTNQGQSVARNEAIRAAHGEYLLFVDADDFIFPGGMENMSQLIGVSFPDVIISDTFTYDEILDKAILRNVGLPAESATPAEALDQCGSMLFAPWVLTVRKEYIISKQLWFKEGIKHEDELWIPKVLLETTNRINNTKPFYCNRCNRIGSTTQKLNINKLIDKLIIIQELLLYSEGRSEDDIAALEKRCAKLLTGIIRERCSYYDNSNIHKIDHQIQQYLYLLKKQAELRYRMLYWAINIAGIQIISRLMHIAKSELL